MIKLAPSILSADYGRLAEEINLVEKAGADYLHIDVMDGHFVPNITIGPPVVASIRKKSNLTFDLHLMVENPDKYIGDFTKAGADIITVHVEACRHLHRTLQIIKEHGIKAGVALNPATPISYIEHVLDEIDMILVMTVNPGCGGQKFINGMLNKISSIKRLVDDRGLNIDIETDGGVKLDNVCEVVKAGSNVIVAGSAIFSSNNVEQTIKKFRINGENNR